MTQPKTAAQLAYERDLEARPLYHDGTPRKLWSELGEVEQWSWGRTFSPRDLERGRTVPALKSGVVS